MALTWLARARWPPCSHPRESGGQSGHACAHRVRGMAVAQARSRPLACVGHAADPFQTHPEASGFRTGWTLRWCINWLGFVC